MVANLLTNAASTRRARAASWSRVRARATRAIVRVRDNGIGIAPELLPRVFDLFVQGAQALDRARGGLGLGLTLVADLVELHGGSVTAASAGPGRGSEFIVDPARGRAAGAAPRRPAAPAERRHARRAPHPGRRRQRRRARDARAAAAPATATRCASRTTARGARGALRDFGRRSALLDIGLPGVDGYELARRLRGRPGAAPIALVALTGYGRSATARARSPPASTSTSSSRSSLDGLDALLRQAAGRAGDATRPERLG